ncbi:MAG: hypothetical protein JWN52_6123, partial [Actinomycetia bacterium]|nr:hypothetical protein [Actinomycetes bacterium]
PARAARSPGLGECRARGASAQDDAEQAWEASLQVVTAQGDEHGAARRPLTDDPGLAEHSRPPAGEEARPPSVRPRSAPWPSPPIWSAHRRSRSPAPPSTPPPNGHSLRQNGPLTRKDSTGAIRSSRYYAAPVYLYGREQRVKYEDVLQAGSVFTTVAADRLESAMFVA